MTQQEWLDHSNKTLKLLSDSVKIVNRCRGFYPLSLEEQKATKLIDVANWLIASVESVEPRRNLTVLHLKKALFHSSRNIARVIKNKHRELELNSRLRRMEKKDSRLARKIANSISDILVSKMNGSEELNELLDLSDPNRVYICDRDKNQIALIESNPSAEDIQAVEEKIQNSGLEDSGFLSLLSAHATLAEPEMISSTNMLDSLLNSAQQTGEFVENDTEFIEQEVE